MSKKGRPAGPAKILFRKRLTAEQLQAVQAVLAGSPQPAALPLAFTPGPSDAERHGLPAGGQLNESLPPLPVDALGDPGKSVHVPLDVKLSFEQTALLAEAGRAGGETIVDGTAAEPLPREYFKAELERTREQLRLQTQRADDLQAQVEELQLACDKKEVELENVLQMGGTERQSAYIARLLTKITALGGDKKEFDQT